MNRGGLAVSAFLPFALIFFFINAVGLPYGLLYTTALAPLFYLWLRRVGYRRIVTHFAFAVLPFALFHLIHGVSSVDYVRSLALSLAVYVSVVAMYAMVNRTNQLERILRFLVYLNLIMAIIALLLQDTALGAILWRRGDVITYGVKPIERLQLFTYEPSYYSTLLAPLVLYAFFRYVKHSNINSASFLVATLIPLAFSNSFGVIGALGLSLLFVHLYYWRRFLLRGYVLAILFAVLLLALIPQISSTMVFVRLQNVITGQDTSGNARTVESYLFAWQMVNLKSIWWGVGFGQIKILGQDIIGWDDGRLPCAVAETLAYFGIIGLAARFSAEIYLFRKTHVKRNYLRLALFTFIFIYQFTGSFVTNVAEYLIWILAFSPVFPQFAVMDRRASSTRDVLPTEGSELLPGSAPA